MPVNTSAKLQAAGRQVQVLTSVRQEFLEAGSIRGVTEGFLFNQQAVE
jgi:hypothetical protein